MQLDIFQEVPRAARILAIHMIIILVDRIFSQWTLIGVTAPGKVNKSRDVIHALRHSTATEKVVERQTQTA